MAILSCEVVKNHQRGGYHCFRAVCDASLTEKEASHKQMMMSYHPAGYGFYAFKKVGEPDTFIYTWECANTCD